ncbi:uncharacterized protein N0V89_004897 [Didymosphaeria variabile]|uniref:EthD domain-containing protein n=1 Tax=Didymosphaeria variabile TaxID=1932322 RepID=A0A9W9CDN5_9PLEO|nr:uncharacterized protein N0V89_004897 [Didymosphaeria variabile]KAJ4356860.1 hypothetical protein N0V89_004897 [Didymosphaeria variabile]
MSSHKTSHLKQIACLRRKANLTRKEFFDHHFQIHGAISDKPNSPNEKPHKYIQVHFFDTAFGERPGGVLGTSNHPWTGRDDMTELYFRNWDHIKACFGSDHVHHVVGPDGLNFNDLETAIPLMAEEKPLKFNGSLSGASVKAEGSRTVAVLYLAVPVSAQDREERLERIFSPALTKALLTHASNEVYGLLANISIPSEQFDIRAYFGGKNMPEYPVTYKIFIKDAGSVSAVRKAQKAFIESVGEKVDDSNTFIAFGVEGMVLDVGNGVKVSSRWRVKTGR